MYYLIETFDDDGFMVEAEIGVTSWNKLNPDEVEYDIADIALYDDENKFIRHIDESELDTCTMYALRAELLEKLLDDSEAMEDLEVTI